jgi:hypothetical protein
LSSRLHHRCARRNEAGAILIEVLAALTITGLLVGLCLPVVAGMLGRWTSGLAKVASDDQLMRATIRLQDEIASATLLRIKTQGNHPPILTFVGQPNGLRFVRMVSVPDSAELQTIAFAIEETADGAVLVRRAQPYDPGQFTGDPGRFASSVAVISGRYRMHFDYVSRDGRKASVWTSQQEMPARIELSLQPTDNRLALPAPVGLIPVIRAGG